MYLQSASELFEDKQQMSVMAKNDSKGIGFILWLPDEIPQLKSSLLLCRAIFCSKSKGADKPKASATIEAQTGNWDLLP